MRTACRQTCEKSKWTRKRVKSSRLYDQSRSTRLQKTTQLSFVGSRLRIVIRRVIVLLFRQLFYLLFRTDIVVMPGRIEHKRKYTKCMSVRCISGDFFITWCSYHLSYYPICIIYWYILYIYNVYYTLYYINYIYIIM